MRSPSIAFALTLLAATAALAPRAARADQGAGSPGFLATPGGLTATSSSATPGLTTTDPEVLAKALDAVSALDLTARFQADKGSATRTVGPIELAPNADVTLHAHVARVAGQRTAVLDSFDVSGTGAKIAGVSIQHAALDSKGQLTVKLSSWVPQLTVKQVEHQASGDVVLHTSWWMPNVTVKADGTAKTLLGFSLGKIDPRVLAHWPPSLDDLTNLASPNPNASAPASPSQLDELAGTLSWTAKGTFQNDSLAVGGQIVQGTADATVTGSAHLGGGRITTIGDASTASVTIHATPQTLGAEGAKLGDSSLALDGKYRLDMPLKDPGKSLAVSFDGKASYSLAGSNLSVALPQGAKLSVTDADASGAATVAVREDTAKGLLSVTSDGTYTAQVTGPVQVTNLGPLGSFEVDGTGTSSGKTTLGTDGTVTIEGPASVAGTLPRDGVVQILEGQKIPGVKTTVQAGAQATLDASDVKVALSLGLAPKGAGVHEVAAGFEGATINGALKGELGLDGAEIHGQGVDSTIDGTATVGVTAPFAASIDPDGKLLLDPAKTSATVPVHVDLKPGTTVRYTGGSFGTSFAIDKPGSSIQVTGQVALDPSGKAIVTELDSADVNLVLGPGTMVVGGHKLSSAAAKTVQLKGRVVFRPDGLDVYGSLTVGLHGDDATPILSVRY